MYFRCGCYDRENQAAFTLVELLVCVLIIGILAALLSLSWSRISRRGESIKTLSNLRAVGVGLIAAANDNDSMFPSVYMWEPDGFFDWMRYLDMRGYIDDGFCKSLDQQYPAPRKLYNVTARRLYPSVWQSGGFGLNTFSGDPNSRTRLTQISQPSKVILAADACFYGLFDSALMEPHLFPSTMCNGNAHYLFCDGHVESLAALNPSDVNSPPKGINETVFLNPEKVK